MPPAAIRTVATIIADVGARQNLIVDARACEGRVVSVFVVTSSILFIDSTCIRTEVHSRRDSPLERRRQGEGIGFERWAAQMSEELPVVDSGARISVAGARA